MVSVVALGLFFGLFYRCYCCEAEPLTIPSACFSCLYWSPFQHSISHACLSCPLLSCSWFNRLRTKACPQARHIRQHPHQRAVCPTYKWSTTSGCRPRTTTRYASYQHISGYEQREWQQPHCRAWGWAAAAEWDSTSGCHPASKRTCSQEGMGAEVSGWAQGQVNLSMYCTPPAKQGLVL